MNTNKIIVLCVILGALAGGLWYRKQDSRQATVATLHELAAGLDASAITDIELSRGNATIRLNKTDSWSVATLHDAPASNASIESLLQAVKALSGELRSDDASILPDYGLDESSALHLMLNQGETRKLHLLLGKGDFRSVFVREKDSAAVYTVPGTILNAAGAQRPSMDGQFWIETSLLKLNLPEISALKVSTPEYELYYARKANTDGNATQEWDMNATRGKAPAEAQIKNTLMAATRPTVAEVVLPPDPRLASLAKPTHIMTVTTGNTTRTVEAIRPDAKNDAVVRLQGSPFAYTMRASSFERLFPSPARESK